MEVEQSSKALTGTLLQSLWQQKSLLFAKERILIGKYDGEKIVNPQ